MGFYATILKRGKYSSAPVFSDRREEEKTEM
jgi:hypothetical protein